LRRIFDITLTVTPDLPVWPGDPPVVLERAVKMEEGADANISTMRMGVHTGTHVDAPYHFIAHGDAVEQLPLEVLIGPVVVVEVPQDADQIDRKVLDQLSISPGTERVLFKTRNSHLWVDHQTGFQENYVALMPDAAEWLVQAGVRLVGIDYLSVAPYADPVPTHRILLGGRVVALEGLDLRRVDPGKYLLCCLPMKLGGSDGAPARVVLMEEI